MISHCRSGGDICWIKNSFLFLPGNRKKATPLASRVDPITISAKFFSSLQEPELILQQFYDQSIYQLTLPDYRTLLSEKLSDCVTEEGLHHQLRLFRLEHMTKIAFADFVLNIKLDESLRRLSELADALILEALAWLSEFCYKKWGTPKNEQGKIQPLLVYGMGKLGGKELNFSSDIDLIFVYPEKGETQGERRSIDNQLFFTRLGQKLISALHQKTPSGCEIPAHILYAGILDRPGFCGWKIITKNKDEIGSDMQCLKLV